MDDIMETGKYSYNADVVCLLTPSDIGRYSAEEEPVMMLEVVKNKLSSFRGQIPLLFKKHVALFSEGNTNPYGITQGTES